MKFTLKKEFPFWIIILMPFLYLAYIWHDLPDRVPMHYDIHGNIDRYGSKQELLIIPFALPVLVYLIFLIIPYIDPKKQLTQMEGKYNSLKMLLTLSMSFLAIYILYTSKSGTLFNPNFLLVILGGLFVVIGNFLKTIRPNYFIGIRTPWTLESEKVWKSTHILAGKLWFFGGILIVLCSLLLKQKNALICFVVLTGLMALIPVLFSYFEFKKQEA